LQAPQRAAFPRRGPRARVLSARSRDGKGAAMTIERQLAAIQKHLKTLKTQATRPRAEARRRMKRLERRTRVQLERAMRRTEPRVRQAVAQATLLSRSFRVCVRAGGAAYLASR